MKEVWGIYEPFEGLNKGTKLTVEARGVWSSNVVVWKVVSENCEVDVHRPHEGIMIEGNDEKWKVDVDEGSQLIDKAEPLHNM